VNPRHRGILLVALLLLEGAVWVEPAGSWLAEPDEARYAEIPREMLASGDFVTPRLNGVPYFEKPPLLYWANAAALRLFGETPWAARLPTRLFGLGTVLTLLFGTAAIGGMPAGLAAAIFYLAAPLGFAFSRVNLTDAPLTFFFTLTLFLARATLLRREAGRPWILLSALAGIGAAGGFLSKGLIAAVLPGAILLSWCVATRRARLLSTLVFGPAALVFLLVAAPWFVLAERHNPGFLHFFFIHEHIQRFATRVSQRPGPIHYFVPVFLGGFLSGLPFFFSSLKKPRDRARWRREDPDALFFSLWFAVVFLFFSLSRSKLPPYLMPAFPAAAALAARALFGPRPAGAPSWRVAALLATILPAWALLDPTARSWIRDYKLAPIAVAGFAVLLLGAWAAPRLSRRSTASALAAFAVGWTGFCVMAALAWPRVPPATALHNFSAAAAAAARGERASVLCYQTYIQGLPWELKSPVPVADYVGELEPQFERRPEVRDALFWSRDRFWSEWKSGKRYVAIVRNGDLREFKTSEAPARVLARAPKHVLLANFR